MTTPADLAAVPAIAHRPVESLGVQPSGDEREGCGVCRFGFVLVITPEAGSHGMVYACICEKGKQKQASIPRLSSIALALTQDEIRDYWPKGAPEASRDRVLRMLSEAKIPPKFLPWSMTSYAERFKGEKDQKRYLKLAAEWIKLPTADRSDLIIYGPNGTGKTGMAIAIARALAEQQQRSLFWTMRELAIAWRETFRKEGATPDAPSEADFLDALVAPDVLILDEVSGQRMSEFVEDTLTMIVDKRQKLQRPTILTLNLPAESGLALEDGEIVTQLLGPTLQDRLRERGQWWAMKGLSRRTTYSRPAEAGA